MLGYNWVSLSARSAACFRISGMAAQRCAKLFRDDRFSSSFITGLFPALADSEGRCANIGGSD
jgi:hypothetical protein